MLSGPAAGAVRDASPDDFRILTQVLEGNDFRSVAASLRGSLSQRSASIKDSLRAALRQIRVGSAPGYVRETFPSFVRSQESIGVSAGLRSEVSPKSHEERRVTAALAVIDASLAMNSRTVPQAIREIESEIKLGTHDEMDDRRARMQAVGSLALTGAVYRHILIRLARGDKSAVQDAMTLAGLANKGRNAPLVAQQFISQKIAPESGAPAVSMTFEERLRRAEAVEASQSAALPSLPAGPSGLSDSSPDEDE